MLDDGCLINLQWRMEFGSVVTLNDEFTIQNDNLQTGQ